MITSTGIFLTWVDWVRRITYKPGWHLQLCSSYPGAAQSQAAEGPWIQVTANVANSDDLKPILITHTMSLHGMPDNISEKDFYGFILNTVKFVEQHEAMEFFKVDGMKFRDPHPSPMEVLYT